MKVSGSSSLPRRLASYSRLRSCQNPLSGFPSVSQSIDALQTGGTPPGAGESAGPSAPIVVSSGALDSIPPALNELRERFQCRGDPLMLRSHLNSTATTARSPAEGYKLLNATSVPDGGLLQYNSLPCELLGARCTVEDLGLTSHRRFIVVLRLDGRKISGAEQ